MAKRSTLAPSSSAGGRSIAAVLSCGSIVRCRPRTCLGRDWPLSSQSNPRSVRHVSVKSPHKLSCHPRACCLVRGHDRHPFGDITDTFLIGQVDCCDLVSSKEDAEPTICCQRSDSDAFAMERAWNKPEPPFEADVVFGGR